MNKFLERFIRVARLWMVFSGYQRKAKRLEKIMSPGVDEMEIYGQMMSMHP